MTAAWLKVILLARPTRTKLSFSPAARKRAFSILGSLAGVGLWLVLLTACTGPTPTTPAPTAAAHEIVITEFIVDPTQLTIHAGDTITWVNTDAARHTITANHREFDSPILYFGDTFSFTFTTPGEYRYSCKVHNDLEGLLIVLP